MLVRLIVVLLPRAANLNHTSSSAVPPQLFTATLEFVAPTSEDEVEDVQVVDDVNDVAPEQLSFTGEETVEKHTLKVHLDELPVLGLVVVNTLKKYVVALKLDKLRPLAISLVPREFDAETAV